MAKREWERKRPRQAWREALKQELRSVADLIARGWWWL